MRRRPREVPSADRASSTALPLHARRALPDDVQVPPVLLAVRDRGAAEHGLVRGIDRSPAGGCCAATRGATAASTTRTTRRSSAADADRGRVIVAGITTPLEDILADILDWLHTTAHLPWAWAIVALTVIVRMLLVPLTVKQIHSMQNLQRLAPRDEGDPEEVQGRQAEAERGVDEVLQGEQHQPGRLVPADARAVPDLHRALLRAARVREAPAACGDLSWLGFVPTIAAPDDVALGRLRPARRLRRRSQIASTLLMSTTVDKMQRNLCMVLPLAFVFVVARFPAGLVLYWVTTNLWTVGQGLITRRLVPRTPVAPPEKRTSRTPAKAAPAPAPATARARRPAAPTPSAGRPSRRRRRARCGARSAAGRR